jgi:hypothetical protein
LYSLYGFDNQIELKRRRDAMKSVWTPEPVRRHWFKEAHPALIWSLWAITIALLSFWLLGMATANTLGGWIHALAGGAVVTGAFCTYQVFQYGEFLERSRLGRSTRRKREPGSPG